MMKCQPYLFEHDVDTSKSRKTVRDEIFTKTYDGEEIDIPIGDLPTDLDPTDILEYVSDPGYYSDNDSWVPFTTITIFRPRLENDEEYETRLDRSRLFLEKRKEERRISYLKLKEEFEPSNEKSEK